MVTILDPLGSPTIVYNKAGKTIQNIVANSGSSFLDAVEITHITEDSIVIIDASGGNGQGAVYFASDFDLGDIITLVFSGGSSITVYNSSGSSIDTTGSNGSTKYVRVNPSSQTWRKID